MNARQIIEGETAKDFLKRKRLGSPEIEFGFTLIPREFNPETGWKSWSVTVGKRALGTLDYGPFHKMWRLSWWTGMRSNMKSFSDKESALRHLHSWLFRHSA